MIFEKLLANGDIYLGVVGAVRTGKSTFIKKVIETLMDRTCQIVNISCMEAIDTLKVIKHKHPHLEKLANECIELLEYYNEYKTW